MYNDSERSTFHYKIQTHYPLTNWVQTDIGLCNGMNSNPFVRVIVILSLLILRAVTSQFHLLDMLRVVRVAQDSLFFINIYNWSTFAVKSVVWHPLRNIQDFKAVIHDLNLYFITNIEIMASFSSDGLHSLFFFWTITHTIEERYYKFFILD